MPMQLERLFPVTACLLPIKFSGKSITTHLKLLNPPPHFIAPVNKFQASGSSLMFFLTLMCMNVLIIVYAFGPVNHLSVCFSKLKLPGLQRQYMNSPIKLKL